MYLKCLKNKKGSTFLEIVIGIGLVAILSTSLLLAFFNASKVMAVSKQKVGAVSIANEKMEIIRNLDYDKIGHPDWIPNGPILQSERVELNGFFYDVDTLISYKDNAFDGESSSDDYENDYKEARVMVSWNAGTELKKIVFISRFVPSGLESEAGGGVLSINVVDPLGYAISEVSVKIDSVDENPSIHGTAITDGEGNVRLPGMPLQEYQIQVSKSEYETVTTYPSYPSSSFNPQDQNIIVVDGVNSKTFTIQKAAKVKIKAEELSDGSDIENLSLDIQGGRLIGTDPETFSLNITEETDSDGEIELVDLSPGEYEILNLEGLETSDLVYVGSDVVLPIQLNAEDELEVNLIFAEKNENSLLVKVQDSETFNSIAGATVKVSGTDFSQSGVSSSDGLIYFPMNEDPEVLMLTGDYDLEIEKEGYENFSKDSIEVDELTEYSADLIIQP